MDCFIAAEGYRVLKTVHSESFYYWKDGSFVMGKSEVWQALPSSKVGD